jgi:hypothetical protein
LGVLAELREVAPLSRELGAQQEGAPLDFDALVLLLELAQPDRCDQAPGSEEVAVDDEPGHDSTVLRSGVAVQGRRATIDRVAPASVASPRFVAAGTWGEGSSMRAGQPVQRVARMAVAVAMTAIASTCAVLAAGPVGAELQVNSYTTGVQAGAAVAAAAGKGFVVAWRSDGQDGDANGVFLQRFSSSGAPLGIELQVSTFTDGQQRRPAVAVESDGDFVVVWQDAGRDGYAYGVFAQRYDSAGVAQGAEFQVNTTTSQDERFPAVAIRGDGDFVVAWTAFLQDGSSDAVIARRFSSGAAQGGELQVNTTTISTQSLPAIAMVADGRFVVAWQSFGQDGDHYATIAQRFDSAGSPLGGEIQVNTYTVERQHLPSVAMSGDGAFMVVWQSLQDGDAYGVFGQRFTSTAVALGGELQINRYTPNDQRVPRVASDGSGGFMVVWGSFLEDDSSDGIFARAVSSSGALSPVAFQVNEFTISTQFSPAIGVTDPGKFVVVWQSFAQDGNDYAVIARRLATAATLDVDGNGSVTALTDGLLVLRFLFDFSGASLTTGALGGGCTRCAAGDIETYLDGLALVLDADGNGTLSALTDGLLILRFEFGFTGATLITGAVGMSCTRCTAAQIIDYLQPLI